jgi:hypothetical protein
VKNPQPSSTANQHENDVSMTVEELEAAFFGGALVTA